MGRWGIGGRQARKSRGQLGGSGKGLEAALSGFPGMLLEESTSFCLALLVQSYILYNDLLFKSSHAFSYLTVFTM